MEGARSGEVQTVKRKKPRRTEAEWRQSARDQLDRWKRPIDSLEAWDQYERLVDIAEGYAES